MGEEEPQFTYINIYTCSYCSYLVLGANREGDEKGCKLIINSEERYARVVPGRKSKKSCEERDIDAVDGYVGCDSFQSSGLPAHPFVLERLVASNPLCSNIPSDPEATETSHEFASKRELFLSPENRVEYTKIQ